MNALQNEIHNQTLKLQTHSMYRHIRSMASLQIFMKYHAFAVWDFMSLLKRLQKEITCVDVPWYPSPHPKKLVRLINEIVLGEESDQDEYGNHTDHFSLYLEGMEEIGADKDFVLKNVRNENFHSLPNPIRQFLNFNIDLAKNQKLHMVAGAFVYGRENLIPSMFTGMLKELENKEIKFDKLKFYLERHIELDGDEHGHLAMEMLEILTANNPQLIEEALLTGIKSLHLRSAVWDFIETQISSYELAEASRIDSVSNV